MADSITLSLKDLAATEAFGLCLGQQARTGDIITLSGSLGAGKTTLTQAIGKGLEVPNQYYITSPTFGLLHEYPGRIPLYHMDLYRLAREEEIEELGFEDFMYGEGLTVIEWPDRLGGLMPEERLHIDLIPVEDANARTAVITAIGDMWRKRLERIAHEAG